MCPQNISDLTDNPNHVFGTDAIHSRPELMALAMRVIAGWAMTEAHLGNIFATLLGSKKFATVEMYAAFDGFSAQRTMLTTAARTVLPKTYFNTFDVVLRVLLRAADHRHKFAHRIWGISQDPKLRESLLLVAPQHFWRMRAQRLRHIKRVMSRDIHRINFEYPRLDPKTIQVYQKPELVKLCEEVEISFQYAAALLEMVSSKPSIRRQISRWLCNQPPIRQVLDEDRRRVEGLRKSHRERDRERRLADQQALKRREAKKNYKAEHA
jgi:hypothetical protein